jgi:putative transposase
MRSTGWGGARAGAGRPARGPVPSEPHTVRPALSPRHPVHVTARMTRGVRSVPARKAHQALQRALRVSLARSDFRIVHIALTAKRVELVVEADDREALARGMQGFQVSAARWFNRCARRSGTVFVDRYRMAILRTRRDVRDAIGRLPSLRRAAWPQTWLLRVDALPLVRRRWIHSRADEDSAAVSPS